MEYKNINLSYGVKYIADGYIEYALEVIKARALADLRDGLKPVQRRICYTMHKMKGKNMVKCGKIVGNVFGLHPHGDEAIYNALVLITDRNGSLAFPLLEGQGNLGSVGTTDKPAAMRYPEARLSSYSSEFFGEMDGITMIPNFDATETEPEVLPVSFPSVLVNATSGIAVGFKSQMPSFNFTDVCNLVKEYIADGECHTVIQPDFVTGGSYVTEDKELMKLMRVGKAKLKFRGKMIKNDKQLVITELPPNKTIQGIVKQINSKEINGVKNATDAKDFGGTALNVYCKNKNVLDSVTYSLYKETDLQSTFSADMTVIHEGIPKQMGVWGIIEEWVKWRKSVLLKSFNNQAEACRQAMREAEAFMNVVTDKERSDKLVMIIKESGKSAGIQYVRENYTREEVPEDLIAFVSTRSINYYHDGGKYRESYERDKQTLDSLEYNIQNVEEYISKEMDRLIANYGTKLARKTEVTKVDFEFAEDKTEKVVDTSSCFYAIDSHGFLRKSSRYNGNDAEAKFFLQGKANDVLIMFDNRGRLLRAYGEDIELNSASDRGIYLPNYFNLNESDDYEITYATIMTGETLMLLYKDGNVGFVDEQEWVGNNRKVKVLERGIAPSCADKLGKVFHESEIPEMLYVTDEAGNIGCAYTNSIKRKDRTAKSRVFTLRSGSLIDSYAGYTMIDGILVLSGYSDYVGKMRPFEMEQFSGNEEDFIMI